MASIDDRARALLQAVLVTIDAERYFTTSAQDPVVVGGRDGGAYTITLLVHVGVLDDEHLLAKGPHWVVDPRHPYIKVEQVWGQAGLARYIYQLSDPSFAFTEGYHFHVETDTQGKGVHHHTQTVGGGKPTWRRLPRETPLAEALGAFVETIWRLRG